MSSSTVNIIFRLPSGEVKTVAAPIGLSVLEIARKYDIYIEGACDGALACSTCHIILSDKWYNKMSDISEEEEDMLDLAFGLTETSRLGCQIIIDQSMDGMEIKIPAESRNILAE